MKNFQLLLPPDFDENTCISKFKTKVEEIDLQLKEQGTLKTIPGSIHWHITKADNKGTLEATFDKNNKSLVLSYHDNRYAKWIDDAVKSIKRELERN